MKPIYKRTGLQDGEKQTLPTSFEPLDQPVPETNTAWTIQLQPINSLCLKTVQVTFSGTWNYRVKMDSSITKIFSFKKYSYKIVLLPKCIRYLPSSWNVFSDIISPLHHDQEPLLWYSFPNSNSDILSTSWVEEDYLLLTKWSQAVTLPQFHACLSVSSLIVSVLS